MFLNQMKCERAHLRSGGSFAFSVGLAKPVGLNLRGRKEIKMLPVGFFLD